MEKKELKPAGVFRFFEEICQIPRPSKHEEKIIAYLQEFGKKYNLKTTTDACGNVLLVMRIARKWYCKPIWIWCQINERMWNMIS